MDNGAFTKNYLAEFLTDDWVSEQELCRHMGIGSDVLRICIEWEVIASPRVNQEGNPLYHSQTVDRLARGLRLHRDLGVNWVGVSIILDMLDRIELIEQQLADRLQE